MAHKSIKRDFFDNLLENMIDNFSSRQLVFVIRLCCLRKCKKKWRVSFSLTKYRISRINNFREIKLGITYACYEFMKVHNCFFDIIFYVHLKIGVCSKQIFEYANCTIFLIFFRMILNIYLFKINVRIILKCFVCELINHKWFSINSWFNWRIWVGKTLAWIHKLQITN